MSLPEIDTNEPQAYSYIVSPRPRPISTIGLGELFNWFFPGDYMPPDRQVHPLALKCRSDPDYTVFYPDGTCAAEREVGHTLFVLCRLMRPENVIEVGCYHGATTMCIAAALRENGVGHLYSIDIDPDSIVFAEQMVHEADLSDRVTFVQGNSTAPDVYSALPEASLVFIDGDHSYQGVQGDFLTYRDGLSDSGIIVLHDSIKHMEIRQLLTEIAEEGKYDIFTLATSDGDGMSLLRPIDAVGPLALLGRNPETLGY